MFLIQSFIIAIFWWGGITGNSFDATESFWKTDYEVALSQAKKEHKTIITDFHVI